MWERVQDLKESIYGEVEPLETVILQTAIVKLALGVYLLQSVFISLWWSINMHAFYPWLFPFSALLMVGWFWNKVTDSWKERRYEHLGELELEDSVPEIRVEAPNIDIQNSTLTSSATSDCGGGGGDSSFIQSSQV